MKITKNEILDMKKRSQRSILWGFFDDIDAMRDEGISYVLILLWLQKQGVDTSLQNIRQFYERHKKASKSPKKKMNSSIKVGGIFSDLK